MYEAVQQEIGWKCEEMSNVWDSTSRSFVELIQDFCRFAHLAARRHDRYAISHVQIIITHKFKVNS